MLFIALLVLSLLSALLWLRTEFGVKYRLDVLSLVSGSAALMFLVDFLHSYVAGETQLEVTLDTAVLSGVVVATAVAIWLLLVFVRHIRR